MNEAFDFQPCREEKCKILSVHPAHESTTGKRAVRYKACPLCKGPLIRLPRKRAFCSDSSCGWRGKDKPQAQQQAQEQHA